MSTIPERGLYSDNGADDHESWQTGRRIVELDTLAENLKSCFACDSPLYLHDTVSSKNYGLASVLDIVCRK